MNTVIDLKQVSSIALYRNSTTNDEAKYVLSYKPCFTLAVSNQNPQFYTEYFKNYDDALCQIKTILNANSPDHDFIKVNHSNENILIFLTRIKTIESERDFFKKLAESFFLGFKNKELKRKRQKKFKKFLEFYLAGNKI